MYQTQIEKILTALTLVLWEADGEGGFPYFFLEEILLVEEEDDGCVCEPLVVADGVEQLHALHHTVLNREAQLMNIHYTEILT